MKTFSRMVVLLSVALLAACSVLPGSALPSATPPPSSEPVTPTPFDAPILPPKAALEAQKALAELLGVPVEEVTIASLKEAEWPDSCLGLGGPAESCLQAVVPGWQVRLEAGGKVYEYRTDQDGSTLRSAGVVVERMEEYSPVVQALAKHLNVNAADIVLVRVEPAQWPDPCLGYINPAELCAQVITPGFKVYLRHSGQDYEIHTDAALTRARLPGGVEILAP
jgi:hypothetical protein